MAKSKNHTNHNQNRKDHKNGIKRPKRFTCESTKGMNQKFLRNLRYARKHNLSKAKLEKLRANKAKVAARIAAKATESKA